SKSYADACRETAAADQNGDDTQKDRSNFLFVSGLFGCAGVLRSRTGWGNGRIVPGTFAVVKIPRVSLVLPPWLTRSRSLPVSVLGRHLPWTVLRCILRSILPSAVLGNILRRHLPSAVLRSIL